VTRRYAILDVFTDRPLAGNPLAVVLDAAGLDDGRMQAVAAEFNLPETAFVLPPENPVHSARIRVFNTAKELPFAGHPTVGTVVLLGLEAPGPDHGNHEMVRVLESGIGPIRCGLFLKDAGGHAIFDVPQLPTEVGGLPDRETIAAAFELMPIEIGFENHRPSGFAVGTSFLFVPVRDLSAIARARPRPTAWAAAFGAGSLVPYLYCRETAGAEHHFHARRFEMDGVGEDPATGSAAAALAAVIARFDQPPGGSHHYLVEQGFEMGRPSLIGLEIDMDDGVVQAARISGDAVVVARGELLV
jgi:trans-2,3-dihydro-3-hydroxyanthranilate isomerase